MINKLGLVGLVLAPLIGCSSKERIYTPFDASNDITIRRDAGLDVSDVINDSQVDDITYFDTKDEISLDARVDAGKKCEDPAHDCPEGGIDAGRDVPADVSMDSGRDVPADVSMDSGRDVPADVSMDSGRDVIEDIIRINNRPTITLINEMGMPYMERSVLSGRNTNYSTRTFDADGDILECRFEFSDGFIRDWSRICNVNHTLDAPIDHTIIARVRDPIVEGDPSLATLHVNDPWFESFEYRRRFLAWHDGRSDIATPVVIGTGDGVLTINTESLIAAGKLNPDCSDLRIITRDLVQLPYEFENPIDPLYGCDTPETLIFTRTSMAAGMQTRHYLYYGNPMAMPPGMESDVWMNQILVYHLNNAGINVLDSSPAANDGSILEGEPLYIPGCIGMGLNFNGGNSITVPNSRLLNFNQFDSFTIQFMVRSSRLPDSAGFIYKAENLPAERGYQINALANRLRLVLKDTSGTSTEVFSTPVVDGTCHHVAFVRDAAAGILLAYTDGVETDRRRDTTLDIPDTGDLTIGYNPRTRFHYQGTADELYISRRALNPDTIMRNYMQELSRIEGSEEVF